MKKLTFIFIVISLFAISKNGIAQDKNEQLWYCWEETVKPEMINEYLELSNDFLELYKSENFPFAIYTWQKQPFRYELWTPINSLSDIDKITEASMKIAEKLGVEKYAAFKNTILHNKEYTLTMRNDLQCTPENPIYTNDEINFEFCISVYIKSGKQKEFEETLIDFNKKRAKLGSPIFVATGGFGMEQPCYTIMMTGKDEETFLKLQNETAEILAKERDDYFNKIYKLMRKPSTNYNWYFLRNLSYEPARN